MKTIKNLKDVTILEVGDVVVFGDLTYEVKYHKQKDGYTYFLYGLDSNTKNDTIFITLDLSATDFVKNLGIETLPVGWIFPEVKSLEALTAIVSALFKEYEKQRELPKTWEEFCKKNPIKTGECRINLASAICITNRSGDSRDAVIDKDYCVSKQEAEAFLALKQLRQLRKRYVGDWEPDWTETSHKYCIDCCEGEMRIDHWAMLSHVLSFPSKELATQFLTNFKNLIEIAKPLL